MRGCTPFELPEHFNVEWYGEQKDLKKTDIEIARELYISYALLAKWKRKIGWKTEQIYSSMCGRKPIVDCSKLLELRTQGWNLKEIAEYFKVHVNTIRYQLNKLNGK